MGDLYKAVACIKKFAACARFVMGDLAAERDPWLRPDMLSHTIGAPCPNVPPDPLWARTTRADHNQKVNRRLRSFRDPQRKLRL